LPGLSRGWWLYERQIPSLRIREGLALDLVPAPANSRPLTTENATTVWNPFGSGRLPEVKRNSIGIRIADWQSKEFVPFSEGLPMSD
jgi:hypothetical protein